MSTTQPVTGSDREHKAVPVRLSDGARQQVQEADSKLREFLQETKKQVKTQA